MWALQAIGVRCAHRAELRRHLLQQLLPERRAPPIRLPTAEVRRFADLARTGGTFTVDLAAQRVEAPDGSTCAFEIEALRRESLLEGLDDIGLTLEAHAGTSTPGARRRRTPLGTGPRPTCRYTTRRLHEPTGHRGRCAPHDRHHQGRRHRARAERHGLCAVRRIDGPTKTIYDTKHGGGHKRNAMAADLETQRDLLTLDDRAQQMVEALVVRTTTCPLA